MVPVTGLEPVRHRWRWILSPLRLPFHHTGRDDFLNRIAQSNQKCKSKVAAQAAWRGYFIGKGSVASSQNGARCRAFDG